MPASAKPKKLISTRAGRRHAATNQLARAFEPGQILAPDAPPLAGTRLLQLASVASLAGDQLKESVYRDRDTRAKVRADSATAVIKKVPRALKDTLMIPGVNSRYPSEVAVALASAMSIGLHTNAHRAFDAGLISGPRAASPDLASDIRDLERRYRDHLRGLRDAVRHGDPDASARAAAATLKDGLAKLPPVCRRAARASEAANGGAALGLRASMLARRWAMLGASAVLIDWRLRNKRTARSTVKFAHDATKLSRSFLRLSSARRMLRPADVSRPTTLLTEVSGIAWVGSGPKPHSSARLVNGSGRIIVPHKSMGRQGVGTGSFVWARGTVKQGNPSPYLEIEFEGPDRHKADYWEDRLAVIARSVYDLYPGSLLMEWEFPRIGLREGPADLYSRLS